MSNGAGKGPDPRPVNMKVWKANLSKIKGVRDFSKEPPKAGKTTYTYKNN